MCAAAASLIIIVNIIFYLFYSFYFIFQFTVPVESTVVLQEHLNKWYYLSTYCASKIIIDLPIQVPNHHFNYNKFLKRPVVAQGHKCVTVNRLVVDSILTRRNEIFI